MKLHVALLALCLPAIATGSMSKVCSGDGKALGQFNGQTLNTRMPCKYNAVRQVCGQYNITLTPGNIFLAPKYRMESLWLEITETATDNNWEGRTDNKLAVKYFNQWKDNLFVKKGGNLATDDIMTFGSDATSTWTEAKNGDFRVTIVPWEPDNSNFQVSSWKFECFSDVFEPTNFPAQGCGGESKKDMKERKQQLGLDTRQVIYFEVFNDTSIAQVNPQCKNATRLFTEVCPTDERRRDAIETCSEILSSLKHTNCVSKYTCDPMDTFVDCLDWVCGDYTDRYACERVGSGIDMCRRFREGDLTLKVDQENCYKDFLSIEAD